MNVKLVQRIEVNLLASFLSEIVLQIFIVISVHGYFYCYFSTCINTTTQVQYHIMFNIKIFFVIMNSL